MANLSKERVKYNKKHMGKKVKTTENNEDVLSIYGGILMVILPVLLLLISLTKTKLNTSHIKNLLMDHIQVDITNMVPLLLLTM